MSAQNGRADRREIERKKKTKRGALAEELENEKKLGKEVQEIKNSRITTTCTNVKGDDGLENLVMKSINIFQQEYSLIFLRSSSSSSSHSSKTQTHNNNRKR